MNSGEIPTWAFGGPMADWPPDHAWALCGAVLGGVAIVAWLSYGHAVTRLALWQRLLLTLMRVLLAAGLVACLANPRRVERTEVAPPPPAKPTEVEGRLAVVVDVSDSMTAEDNRGRTRLDDAISTWRRFEGATAQSYREITYHSLSTGIRPAATLEEAAANREGTGETALWRGVQTLLAAPAEERPDAIVLLTDGVDTTADGDAKARASARTAGVPIHVVAGMNRDRPEPYLRVREWRAPVEVLRQTEFVVEAAFEAFSREDREVPYSLWRGDERIERGVLSLTRGSNLIPWSARVAAGETGAIDLVLRMGDGFEERMMARSVTAVEAQKPISVVVFQGALDWGFRYLTDALRTDPNFSLATVVSPTVGIVLSREVSSGTNAQRLVGVLSEDASRLESIDCIVLARTRPDQLGEARQRALVDFVRGGGALLFVNTDPAAAGQFASSPLGELAPVVLASSEMDAARRGLERSANRRSVSVPLTPFALTEAGRASPIFAQAGHPEGTWLEPRFVDAIPAFQVKPGAEVLAIDPTRRDPSSGAPQLLLATQHFGRGRTAFLATDALWRWKMSEPSHSRAVETFWQQLILAVGRRTGGERMRFVDPPAEVTVGDPVVLRIAGTEGAAPPEVRARLPDGGWAHVEVSPGQDTTAPWQIVWKPEEAGAWELVATAPGSLPAYAFSIATSMPTGEQSRQPTATASLRAFAGATGGSLLADRLPLGWQSQAKSTATTAEPIVVEETHLLWNRGWVLGLLLGLYLTELVLRRTWRLQ